jgi:hypothetical protein
MGAGVSDFHGYQQLGIPIRKISFERGIGAGDAKHVCFS